MNYNKFEIPQRTEIFVSIGYEIQAELSILGETEKAYHIIYATPIKKGYTSRTKFNDILMWVPKSIWNNDKYFVKNEKEEMFFNKPSWIK